MKINSFSNKIFISEEHSTMSNTMQTLNESHTNNLQDTLQLSSPSSEPLPSETYNKTSCITSNKAFKMSYNCSQEIETIAKDTMTKYYNHELPTNELSNAFETCCNLYLHTLKEIRPNYNNKQMKEKAIEHVFTSFQRINCYCSLENCNKIAKSIASSYGNNEGREDFVYYDSDIYYYNKDIQNTLTDIVQSMFTHYGLELNSKDKIAEWQKNTNISGGLTFNSTWNNNAKYGVNICTMTSIDAEPPKGFKFFYKQNQNASMLDKNGSITLDSQKGVLVTIFGEKANKIDVPFNNSTNLGPLIGIFNAGKLLNINETTPLLNFLNYFNIYTRTYSFINYNI